MKLKLILLSICLLICGASIAQNTYKTALGLRAVPGAGFTIKHNLNSKASIEGILGTRWRGIHLTGLYQVNYPVFTEPGFRFYMGAGAHVGFWNGRYNPWWDNNNESHAVFGIDGQIGLEYTFDEIPLNLSIDWKPGVNLIGTTNFWGDEIGLSVRYAIK